MRHDDEQDELESVSDEAGGPVEPATYAELPYGLWPDMKTPPEPEELDALGFSKGRKCPVCGAGLYWSRGLVHSRMICLNACHLGEAGASRFRDHMSQFMGRGRKFE